MHQRLLACHPTTCPHACPAGPAQARSGTHVLAGPRAATQQQPFVPVQGRASHWARPARGFPGIWATGCAPASGVHAAPPSAGALLPARARQGALQPGRCTQKHGPRDCIPGPALLRLTNVRCTRRRWRPPGCLAAGIAVSHIHRPTAGAARPCAQPGPRCKAQRPAQCGARRSRPPGQLRQAVHGLSGPVCLCAVDRALHSRGRAAGCHLAENRVQRPGLQRVPRLWHL